MCETGFGPLLYMMPGLMFSVFFVMVLLKYKRQVDLLDISDDEKKTLKSKWALPKNWFNPKLPGFYMLIADILLIIGFFLYLAECN